MNDFQGRKADWRVVRMCAPSVKATRRYEPNITDLMITTVTLLSQRVSFRFSVSLSVSSAPAASSVHSFLITPRHSCGRASLQSFQCWMCKNLNCNDKIAAGMLEACLWTNTDPQYQTRGSKRFFDGRVKQVSWFVVRENLP